MPSWSREIFGFIAGDGGMSDDWIAAQIRYADRTDGDIDTLSQPHRADPHLDLRRQPAGLACRSRALARRDARRSRTVCPTPCTKG